MEEEELDLDLHAITGKHLSSNKQLTIEKTFVRLPSEYSQSTLNGRTNKSFASSTIALLVGKYLKDMTDLNTDFLDTFVGCMEFGNLFHQENLSSQLYEIIEHLEEESFCV